MSEKNLEEQHRLASISDGRTRRRTFSKSLWLDNDRSCNYCKTFPDDVLKTSVNLYEQGYLQFKLGNIHLAEELLQETLNLVQTDDFVNHACAYRGLAEVMLAKGDIKMAKSMLKKHWRVLKKQIPLSSRTEDLMTQIQTQDRRL